MKKALVVLVLFVAFAFGAWHLARARTVQLFGEIVPRVETEKKVIALTFDDGPQSETVDEILNVLAQKNVKATFFVCGAEIEQHPEAARKLVRAGHELGNHSYSHVRMVFKSPSFIRDEFERTDALIRSAGHAGPIHVRAPYCKKLVGLPWYFARNHRTHVTFDVEPETFPEVDADANAIINHVAGGVRPGSIVLLHPWYRNRGRTRAALPRMIDILKDRGYAFVTVDELMRLR